MRFGGREAESTARGWIGAGETRQGRRCNGTVYSGGNREHTKASKYAKPQRHPRRPSPLLLGAPKSNKRAKQSSQHTPRHTSRSWPFNVQQSYQQILILIYLGLETTPFIPKGYVAKERQRRRRPAAVLDRSARANEIRRPPQCAVRKTRGQEYPLTKKK